MHGVVGLGEVDAGCQDGLILEGGPLQLCRQQCAVGLRRHGHVRQALQTVALQPLADFTPPLVGPKPVQHGQEHHRSGLQRGGRGGLGPGLRQQADDSSTKCRRPPAQLLHQLEHPRDAAPECEGPLPHASHCPAIMAWGLGAAHAEHDSLQLFGLKVAGPPAWQAPGRGNSCPAGPLGLLPQRPPCLFTGMQKGGLPCKETPLLEMQPHALQTPGPFTDPPEKGLHAPLRAGLAPGAKTLSAILPELVSHQVLLFAGPGYESNKTDPGQLQHRRRRPLWIGISLKGLPEACSVAYSLCRVGLVVPGEQLLPPPLAEHCCREAGLLQVASVQFPPGFLVLLHHAGCRGQEAWTPEAVALAHRAFQQRPHGVDILGGNGLHPGEPSAVEGRPELQVREGLLLLARALVSDLPGCESCRLAFAEGAPLKRMGAQARVPVHSNSLDPGLHVLRQPALIDAAGLVAVGRFAGGLRTPINPTRSAQHFMHSEVSGSNVPVACYHTGPSAKRTQLKQDVLQHSTEFLLLRNGGPVVAIHHGHAACVPVAKVDDRCGRAVGPLALAVQG